MKFSLAALILTVVATVKASDNHNNLRGGERELREMPNLNVATSAPMYKTVFSTFDQCNNGQLNKCEVSVDCGSGYKIQADAFNVFDCTQAVADGKPINQNNCDSFAAGARPTFTLVQKAFGREVSGEGPASKLTFTGMAGDDNAGLRASAICEKIVMPYLA